jgi:hypothetical protein
MDWILKPFGLTQDQQAETYAGQLKDDRSGTKDWNAGDMLRDVLTPGTREELEAKAKAFKEDKINKLSSKTRGTITESLSGTKIDATGLKIGDKETQEEYDTRLEGLQTRGAANVRNLAIPGYDPSKVTAGMGASEIVRLGTTQKTTNTDTAKKEAQKEVERVELRGDKIRGEATTESARIRSDDRAYQQDQLSFQRRENNLNRTQERELSDSRDGLQMQIAIMNNDLSEKRMDYDRETLRMDKRDRMIAQLMSGLGALSVAFG